MKPIFWLDVLSSNSICLMAVISMLYFSYPLPPLNKLNAKVKTTTCTFSSWNWQW